MTNEQQERHNRFDEEFPNERSVFDNDDPYNTRRNAIKSFIDKEVSIAVANREKEILEMIKEIETPIFEGVSGFTYNSGWNDGEKSGQYHLKAEILSLISKPK